MGQFLAAAVDFLWGLPLLFFLTGAGVILLMYSRFVPFFKWKHALHLIAKKKIEEEGEGQLSHFQALCNALAATIGLGNIAGVAVAIYQGGPGALFWMWVAALLGMNIKFFECSQAVLYRGRNYKGEVQGGPMYVIDKVWGKKGHFLAVFFALCGMIGTLSLFQVNQLSSFMNYYFEVPKIAVGIIASGVIAIILIGGLERISEVTSRLVPLMSLVYLFSCVVIAVMNYDKVLGVFGEVFSEAFAWNSAVGGFSGYALKEVIITGFKRATFSNEAGIGTEPMAHSNVKTNEPISEGYVAMIGPFWDTIVVCTLTAIVILIYRNEIPDKLNGVQMTAYAFDAAFGVYGKYFLGLSVVLFSFSTMIGMANYNSKCWDYLFQGKSIFRDKAFILFYCLSILAGSVLKITNVVNLMDVAYALMSVPNIIITLKLASEISRRLKDYNSRHKI